MLDIMIDLETMGTSANSAIVSYGAAQFDWKTGEVGHTIYRVVDLGSSIYFKRTVEASTIYWWLQQKDEARLALVQEDNRETLDKAMYSLKTFFTGCGNPKKLRLWGNGPTFDNSMIRDTFKASIGEDIPIPFWNDRCVRTVKGFYPDQLWYNWRINNPRAGAYHNALDDCKYQIKYLCHILNELGVEDMY